MNRPTRFAFPIGPSPTLKDLDAAVQRHIAASCWRFAFLAFT